MAARGRGQAPPLQHGVRPLSGPSPRVRREEEAAAEGVRFAACGERDSWAPTPLPRVGADALIGPRAGVGTRPYGAGRSPPSWPPREPSEAVRVGKRSRSGRSELCRLRRSEGSGACGDAVTVRLFATPGFPPPRAGLRAARAALRSPSLRSIRAAHSGSPLLFYPISGQKERGVIPLVLFGLFTSPRR